MASASTIPKSNKRHFFQYGSRRYVYGLLLSSLLLTLASFPLRHLQIAEDAYTPIIRSITTLDQGMLLTDTVTANANANSNANATVTANANANAIGAKDIQKNQTSIIIAFSDDGYKEIAWKWYQELEKLGYDEHEVIAYDESSAEYFKQKGMRYDKMYSSFNASYSLKAPNCIKYVEETFKTESKKLQYHRRNLFGSRWNYILRRLVDGHDVLISDTDNVFVRYVPLSQLKHSHYDAYHAYAGISGPTFPMSIFKKQGFTICGGMSWLRSTPGVIEFVRSIVKRCKCEKLACSCHCDDQVVINSIIYDTEYKIDWDQQDVATDSDDEMYWESKTGICNKTGHRVKIWDRHTAYRANFDYKKCPNENRWFFMPYGLSDRSTVWDLWRKGCGRNQSTTI